MTLATIDEDLSKESEIAPRRLNRRVLLLGNDDRVLLAAARGLGREGLEVHVAWCDPKSPALKSRYVAEFHSIPNYDAASTEWLDALHDLTRTQGYDLVIPCNDYAVVPLQMHRAEFSDDVPLYLINSEAFEVAFDKAKTGEIARDLGIHTPREFDVDELGCIDFSTNKGVVSIEGQTLRFPVFVKPRSSITQSDIENKRSARRIEDAGQLAEDLHDEFPSDGLLIQENFAGEGVGVEVLASEGEVLMQLQHRRLRETIDGGSTYRESIAEIPDLSDATRKFVRRLSYTGVAMFEYRYCVDTQTWVFLEINARFWGSLPLAIASGANFPHALYQLIVDDRREFQSSYEVGRRCRNLVTDLRAYRKQPDSPLQLARLLSGQDSLDFFAADDWRPQLASLGELTGSLLRKLFRR